MNRQPNLSNLQYRDPTLREVIDYLKSNDENIVIDASGYLQHLTYNNDLIKEDTRQYGGIPLLIRLLQHRNSEVVRNSCGSLKNLAFGRANDINKVCFRLPISFGIINDVYVFRGQLMQMVVLKVCFLYLNRDCFM